MNTPRTANLASVFQEVITAIVRVRFRLQSVNNAETFRTQIRQSLQTPMQAARSLGYSAEQVQGAVFAVVALLDESVLNLQDPVFGQWARRPLQEELFGGHLAGETFFRNLRAYLEQSDSPHLADVLELHCLCLQLGYRGRYALGDSGELYAMQRQARARIQRIRGDARLFQGASLPKPAMPVRTADWWTSCLLYTSLALACLLLIGFIGYHFSLSAGAGSLQHIAVNAS
ncbi:putative transmembrane protein [Acidisarcina polymorpha]|uniref:Putative transmembrane protein n=1 Tax=Acidisarcina polymorpha TaxID=2211140 RepID=A0A2Z5G2M2_9BACT|nr:DotU family type IV/VI secretion system protein [Acidisarcina polymorpha]AXC13362.1 putative transmembrane protein [Acidisarcina polymorpha]